MSLYFGSYQILGWFKVTKDRLGLCGKYESFLRRHQIKRYVFRYHFKSKNDILKEQQTN